MKGYEILLNELRKAKKDLLVKDLMTEEVKTISPESSMYEAIQDMKRYQIHGLIVAEGSIPQGIVTTYDAMLVIAKGIKAEKIRVGHVMSTSLVYTRPDEKVLNALEKMLDNQFTKLPVVKDGKLVGILSATDLIEAFDTGFFEEQTLEEARKGPTAKDMMHEAVRISEDATVQEASGIMIEKGAREMIIEGETLGILTERDIFKKVAVEGLNAKNLRVSEIMSSPCITIDSGEDASEAIRLFDEKQVRRLLVTENSEAIGILSADETAKTVAMRHRML